MSEWTTGQAEPSEADVRFEQKTRALLQESADGMSAQMRSRLNRARHAALATRPSWSRSVARRWMPAGAGALAAAALVVMVMAVPHRTEAPAGAPLAAAPVDDLEMLADSDAVQLGREDDVDYDFYEWAVGEANGASAPDGST